jgi:hypothetical protein
MEDDHPSPDWHEIITLLRLEAGRIMEDTSVELASILPSDHEACAVRLREDREAADDIQALLAAAQILHRRCLGADNQD